MHRRLSTDGFKVTLENTFLQELVRDPGLDNTTHLDCRKKSPSVSFLFCGDQTVLDKESESSNLVLPFLSCYRIQGKSKKESNAALSL